MGCEDIKRPGEDNPNTNTSMTSMASTKKKAQRDEGEDGGMDDGTIPGGAGGPQAPEWAGTFDTNAVAAMMQDQNMQHLLAQLVQTLPGPGARVHPDDPFIDAGFLGQMFHSQTISSMSKLQEAIEKLSITAEADGKKEKGGKAKKSS